MAVNLINLKEAPHTGKEVATFDGKKYYNASYTGFPKQELILPDNDYKCDRTIAIKKNSKDGVKPMTKEEQDFERSLNWKVIKKFTMEIFKMDVTKFSFPVGYNEPRTFVERATDLFSFLVTKYMDDVLNTTDPVQRFSYLAVGIIAGFHLYLQKKKPWNPVLGETYVGQWSNGVTMYGEQTSHHPPVSNIQVIPPDNKWRIDAQFNFGIDQGIFLVNILQKGLTKLTLNDGTIYEWEFPTISVTGIVKGDRVVKVKGPFVMRDLTNNLEVFVNVNPSKSNSKNFQNNQQDLLNMNPEQFEQVMANEEEEKKHHKKEKKEKKDKKEKKEKKPKNKYPVTSIEGGVRKMGEEKFLSLIHGDYTSEVYINTTKVWSIKNDISERPLKPIPDDMLLLSDCRYRIDRAMLVQGDMKKADKAKLVLEECQRHDYKLRDSVPKKK
ncbi:Oxysterol binding protein [Tritrichomonas foetus]|uniref:Oxysterol binding protein n=1 Tax=Tritrichomonas foetus TaxID=1144522 RepID=A0A1J4JHE6_9EUKA|nr:Oxysterol binding protein [Tritrichomonas foetus]|eukprot:OHS98558.1 Oxysterol binding protein [Tritrichomonas foetus]